MKTRKIAATRLVFLAAAALAICCPPLVLAENVQGGAQMTLSVTSPAFGHQQDMPKRFTCDGDNLSPPLVFKGVPAGAKSLALIVDDPDAPDPKAPKMTWVHWVLYNIGVAAEWLKEGAKAADLPAGTMQGSNDWKRSSYGGPCPPIGRHRYFFKLYALDTVLPDLKGPTKATLEEAMQGHILEKTELIGTYQR